MSEQNTTNEKPIEEPVAEAQDVVEEAVAPEAASQEAEAQAAGPGEIVEELSALGQKFAAVVQKAWDSDQRKEIEREIREGLRTAGERLDDVAEDLRDSSLTADVKTQASKVIDTVEESKVTKEIRKGLLGGLRRLNQELNSLLEKSKHAEAPAEAAPVEPAPVEEPPTE